MKMCVRRWLGASTLALLFSFSVVGCSGDQEPEDGVDQSNNQAADNNAGDNAAGSDENGGGDKTAEDNSAGDGGNAAATGSETADAAPTGNSTESDLQDIITEMNGQSGDKDAAAAPADGAAPQQDAAAPAAPAAGNAVAASTPAPAPAAAPAPAKDGGEAKAAMPFQPGGTPAAAGLPEMGSKMAYIVEKGDTLAKISQKIYGSPSHWQEMASLSNLSNPSRIYPGDLVYFTLDETAVNFAKAYDSVQRSEEQVKPGDTLATISQRLYGSTESWRTIWRHNDKIDNPDVVQPGSTVYYVAKGALQAAIKQVKANVTNLATVSKTIHNSKSQLTSNHVTVSHTNVIAMSHHKKHRHLKPSTTNTNLTVIQRSVALNLSSNNV